MWCRRVHTGGSHVSGSDNNEWENPIHTTRPKRARTSKQCCAHVHARAREEMAHDRHKSTQAPHASSSGHRLSGGKGVDKQGRCLQSWLWCTRTRPQQPHSLSLTSRHPKFVSWQTICKSLGVGSLQTETNPHTLELNVSRANSLLLLMLIV